MPATHRASRRDCEPSGAGMVAAGLGAAVLIIVCCAGPGLIAAGALRALGGFLGNPWVIAAAVLLLAATVTALVHRRRAGRDVCCPPTGQRHLDPAASSGRPTEPSKSAPSVSDRQRALDTAGDGECPPLDTAGRGGRAAQRPAGGAAPRRDHRKRTGPFRCAFRVRRPRPQHRRGPCRPGGRGLPVLDHAPGQTQLPVGVSGALR